MMAAALLARGATVLRNVPDLTDVHLMAEILETLGCEVTLFDEPGVVVINVVDEAPIKAPYELVSEMRASFCVLGPLLARRGEGEVVPFAFAGVSLCDERLFKDAPEGRFSLNLLWDRALSRGRLYGMRMDGRWMHVGTPEALAAAEDRLR